MKQAALAIQLKPILEREKRHEMREGLVRKRAELTHRLSCGK
jgi:hypothetical protein